MDHAAQHLNMRVFCAVLALLLVVVAVAQAHVQDEEQNYYSALDEDEPEVPECHKHFTREMRLVCASNGRIYSNPSIFTYHQCRAERLHRQKLTMQTMALCDQSREL